MYEVDIGDHRMRALGPMTQEAALTEAEKLHKEHRTVCVKPWKDYSVAERYCKHWSFAYNVEPRTPEGTPVSMQYRWYPVGPSWETALCVAQGKMPQGGSSRIRIILGFTEANRPPGVVFYPGDDFILERDAEGCLHMTGVTRGDD